MATALKSVMSKNDIDSFIGLKRAERLESLINLRDLVCGIYLLNKDSGFYGEGLEGKCNKNKIQIHFYC